MSDYTEIFEALSDRFAACGGYDYDEPQEMDETGAPWMSEGAVGISLDSSGRRSIEISLPARSNAHQNWGWQIVDGTHTVARGELTMTWTRWQDLQSGANKAPYRIGGKAAGELEAELMDRAEA